MSTPIRSFLVIVVLPFSAIAQSLFTVEAGSSVTGEANTDICADTKTVDGELGGTGTWCNSEALPVELTSFCAITVKSRIRLDWTTATESNSHGFEIESRAAGTDRWRRIGFVEGAGASGSPLNYSFTDTQPEAGRYVYRMRLIDRSGSAVYSPTVEAVVDIPSRCSLLQNFPNPFNPSTVIRFELAEDAMVRLEVVDALGRCVAELVNSPMKAGYHEATWIASTASGVYFCRIELVPSGGAKETFVDVRRMLLIR